jgi:AbrB family looped-hinge helix DNA binding protein
MVKTVQKKATCCGSESGGAGCCRVEALISVDERGQMVLPKDLRERGNILPGDKLALISWEKDGKVCCLTLIKADSLADSVRDFLGPVMGDLSAVGNQKKQ